MNETLEQTNLTPEDRHYLDQLVFQFLGKPGMLLSVLERIQEKQAQKYLPLDFLEYVAIRAGIPAAQVFSVATFYSLFNLKPQGRHTVCICRGTACHTRGSQRLLESVQLQLGTTDNSDDEGSADKISATTPDGEFTLRTVACFGQCALAPVVEVDHQIRSHVNERALSREIETLRREKH
jgi:NADH-quinone oxidoreductase subunit E